MKKCPFCAEKIQDEAIKCKHCGEWFQEKPSKVPESINSSLGKDPSLKSHNLRKPITKQQKELDQKDLNHNAQLVEYESGDILHPKSSQSINNEIQEQKEIDAKKLNLKKNEKPSKAQDIPTSVSKPSQLWLILIGIFLIGAYAALFIPAFAGQDINPSYGYGSMFWNGLFFYILWKRRVHKGWYGTLIGLAIGIFTFFVASVISGFSHQQRVSTQMVDGLKKDIISMVESSVDSQGLPKVIERRIDTTPIANGDLGNIERTLKEIINQSIEQRNNYLNELDAIEWSGVLDFQRLITEDGITESRMKIKRARQIVSKYQEKRNTLIQSARFKIESLDLSESQKQEALSGFDRGVENVRVMSDLNWKLEREIITEIENIIDFLSTRNNAWIVEEGQIYFQNDDDVNKFNSYLEKIDSITSE